MSGAMIRRMVCSSSVLSQTGSNPTVVPLFGSAAISGTGMNGSLVGSYQGADMPGAGADGLTPLASGVGTSDAESGPASARVASVSSSASTPHPTLSASALLTRGFHIAARIIARKPSLAQPTQCIDKSLPYGPRVVAELATCLVAREEHVLARHPHAFDRDACGAPGDPCDSLGDVGDGKDRRAR